MCNFIVPECCKSLSFNIVTPMKNKKGKKNVKKKMAGQKVWNVFGFAAF